MGWALKNIKGSCVKHFVVIIICLYRKGGLFRAAYWSTQESKGMLSGIHCDISKKKRKNPGKYVKILLSIKPDDQHMEVSSALFLWACLKILFSNL